MRIIIELKNYLKNTDIKKYSFNTPAEKRKSFLQVFLTYFLIVFIFSIITGIVRILFDISFVSGLLETPIFVMLNILAFPILEEIAFRLPLKYERLNLCLSVLIISYYIISILLAGDVVDVNNRLIIRIVLSITIAILIYTILGVKKNDQKVGEFWDGHYKMVFYSFLLMFTFRHLDSYMLTISVLFLSPILLLPQFIGGIFFSYARVRFGFMYSVLLHVIINTIAFTPRLILYYAN